MRRSRLFFATLSLAALMTAACGGRSPTAPTAPASESPAAAPSPGSSSAATVAGTVFSGSGAGVTTMGVALGGATVTIVGTSMTTTSDAAGRFAFTGVPTGDVDVQFAGGAANARIRLSGVREREQIEITVSITGASGDLLKEHRVTGSEAQLEGRISGVNVAARTFDVEDVRASIPAGTSIQYGSRTLEMSELQVGDRVHAKGSKSGAGLTAREVELQNPATRPSELAGAVSGLSGTCPARTFRIGSTTVTTSDATTFLGGSCRDLADARRVEVRGVSRDGAVNATVVKLEDAEAEDASARGAVSNVRGACPGIQFNAGGKTIVTNAETQFLRGACGQIAAGVTVEVEGPASGSTITARKVQFEDGAGGTGETEVEGTVSGLSGTCPVLVFTAAGKTVRTTASTEFRDGACSGLSNGRAVNAKGTPQPDGSVAATRVTTK